jgi:hypothetical protein
MLPNEYIATTDRDYGKCDRCPKPASFLSGNGDDINERLCSEHRGHDVKQSNLATLRKHRIERAALAESEYVIPLVIYVSTNKNLEGSYYAQVRNPMNSCGVGFGSTPNRALRDLALKLADDADHVLHRIKEDAFEERQLEKELADAH